MQVMIFIFMFFPLLTNKLFLLSTIICFECVVKLCYIRLITKIPKFKTTASIQEKFKGKQICLFKQMPQLMMHLSFQILSLLAWQIYFVLQTFQDCGSSSKKKDIGFHYLKTRAAIMKIAMLQQLYSCHKNHEESRTCIFIWINITLQDLLQSRAKT